MELSDATALLNTLGHPGRLSVFRLLMRHAPQGVRPTEMAVALGFKQNTLSHYLADLEAGGLIRSERSGRSLHYAVDLGRAADMVAYLVNDCCRGRPDLWAAPASGREAMQDRIYNVLFICSGNSARSIFAEALLRQAGGRFTVHSAGTRPGSTLNPYALTVMQRAGVDITGLRAKHISEFQGPEVPEMDFVFTVCDIAASEDCAPWPGQPITAHWGVADPVKAVGTDAEKALAFQRAFAELKRRITAFAALPQDQLDKVALQRHIDAIGQDKE